MFQNLIKKFWSVSKKDSESLFPTPIYALGLTDKKMTFLNGAESFLVRNLLHDIFLGFCKEN